VLDNALTKTRRHPRVEPEGDEGEVEARRCQLSAVYSA